MSHVSDPALFIRYKQFSDEHLLTVEVLKTADINKFFDRESAVSPMEAFDHTDHCTCTDTMKFKFEVDDEEETLKITKPDEAKYCDMKNDETLKEENLRFDIISNVHQQIKHNSQAVAHMGVVLSGGGCITPY